MSESDIGQNPVDNDDNLVPEDYTLQMVKTEAAVSDKKDSIRSNISATLGILATVFGIHKRHIMIRAAFSNRANRNIRPDRNRLQDTRINFSSHRGDELELNSLIESKYILPASSLKDAQL